MSKDRLSIYLSYLLRHNPNELSLSMDCHGWVPIEELIERINQRGKYHISREVLQEIVVNDKKGRYRFSQDQSKIKACQGHSISWVEPELEYTIPPSALYHGTTWTAYQDICKSGAINNADTFVGELIWGLQNGTYNDFRTKYRSLDVLIVEDIQFLAGKTTTQEELYYLVDYLYQNNKQLIFSANSYPSAIAGMETYLYSKFEQGIVIGIEAPDFQVRKEIVTRLDQTHKLGLCSEAILFVVEALPDNVRKIVGAMKRLRAARDIDGATLTLEQVKIIINQLV